MTHLWINSAALSRADGDLDVDGGVVERDASGQATGVLREEACWRFRDRHIHIADGEYLQGDARGPARGGGQRRDVGRRQGRLDRALRLWQALAAEGALSLRVWQSLPADHVEQLAALDMRGGLGDGMLRIGYLKAFMDGTLGSQTARMLDGTGVEITSRERSWRSCGGGAAGWPVAVHAIGDLANREALDAFEETRGGGRRSG